MSENPDPVKKSTSGVVLDAAIFCIRSAASMVLVVSNVLCIVIVIVWKTSLSSLSERTEPKA